MGVDTKIQKYGSNEDYGLIIQHYDIPPEIHCDKPIMSTYEIMDLDCRNQSFMATNLNTNQIINHSTKEEMTTPNIGTPTQITNNITSRPESPKMNNPSSVASICSIAPIQIIPVVENHTGDLQPVGCQFSLLSCSIGSALFNLSLSNDSEDETTDDESSDDEDEVVSEDEDDSVVFEDDNENSEGEDEVDCSYFKKARQRMSSESESDDGIVFQDEVDLCPSSHLKKSGFKIYEDEFSDEANNSMSSTKNQRALQQRLSSDCESEDGFIVFQNDGNDCSTSAKKCSSGKKVQFAKNLCSVRRLVHWDFAHRAARKGPWMQMSTDRGRFKMRIVRCASALNKILDLSHREKVYKERFLDSTNQC